MHQKKQAKQELQHSEVENNNICLRATDKIVITTGELIATDKSATNNKRPTKL